MPLARGGCAECLNGCQRPRRVGLFGAWLMRASKQAGGTKGCRRTESENGRILGSETHADHESVALPGCRLHESRAGAGLRSARRDRVQFLLGPRRTGGGSALFALARGGAPAGTPAGEPRVGARVPARPGRGYLPGFPAFLLRVPVCRPGAGAGAGACQPRQPQRLRAVAAGHARELGRGAGHVACRIPPIPQGGGRGPGPASRGRAVGVRRLAGEHGRAGPVGAR